MNCHTEIIDHFITGRDDKENSLIMGTGILFLKHSATYSLKKIKLVAGEMAQWLRPLAALAASPISSHWK